VNLGRTEGGGEDGSVAMCNGYFVKKGLLQERREGDRGYGCPLVPLFLGNAAGSANRRHSLNNQVER